MFLANIKRCESVPGQGIAKLKHSEQKTIYSILVQYQCIEWKIITIHYGMTPHSNFIIIN